MASTTDTAIVVHVKPFGEAEAVVTFFGVNHGLGKGLLRLTKTSRPLAGPGNVVKVEHYRRLENQLGKLTLEEVWSAAPLAMTSKTGVLLINWLTELLATLLPEEHPYPSVFDDAVRLLRAGTGGELWHRVAEFEKLLVGEVGYGLALAEDPVRDSPHEELVYVSPKTGRAVGAGAGAIYKEKLFTLPHIWGGPSASESDDRRHALAITGHFLTLASHGKSPWPARSALLQNL